ncbi:hypothetical protein [Pseudochrobactrum sp. B5]|uniref:hypothetical protein n=1 Tax=Pseudochrobactrum sp. B5 TaxID=1289478 RepID=UPI000952DB73|nr:hypothetical protein [Pseudochrobactrum sp. B5]
MNYYIKNTRIGKYMVLGSRFREFGFFKVDLKENINKLDSSTKWKINLVSEINGESIYRIVNSDEETFLIDSYGPVIAGQDYTMKEITASLEEYVGKLNLYFSAVQQKNSYRIFSVDKRFALFAYNFSEESERPCMMSGYIGDPDIWLLEEAA